MFFFVNSKFGFINLIPVSISAVIAFISYLCAYLSGKKNIILSNESSANEETVIGRGVNHQYSKTFEFENAFIKGAGAREFSIFLNFDADKDTTSRLGTKTFEFRFNTENWSGLINYRANAAGDFVDFGQWGSQMSVWFEYNELNQIVKAHYWMNIAYINTLFGEGTMSKTSTVNWTMSQWNGDDASPFFGISNWTVADGSRFCDPASPSSYMGFNSYNQFVACVCDR